MRGLYRILNTRGIYLKLMDLYSTLGGSLRHLLSEVGRIGYKLQSYF